MSRYVWVSVSRYRVWIIHVSLYLSLYELGSAVGVEDGSVEIRLIAYIYMNLTQVLVVDSFYEFSTHEHRYTIINLQPTF